MKNIPPSPISADARFGRNIQKKGPPPRWQAMYGMKSILLAQNVWRKWMVGGSFSKMVKGDCEAVKDVSVNNFSNDFLHCHKEAHQVVV